MNVFVGSWITRLYTGAVGAAVLGLLVAPQVAGVLLVGLTSPVSIIFAPIFLLGEGWLTVPMMITSVLAGYLLNIAVINLIARPRWTSPSGTIYSSAGAASLPSGRSTRHAA